MWRRVNRAPAGGARGASIPGEGEAPRTGMRPEGQNQADGETDPGNWLVNARRNNPWTQQVRSQARQLEVVAEWLKHNDPADKRAASERDALKALDEGIKAHLEKARKVLDKRLYFHGSGAIAVGSALARVHAAEELLLRRGNDDYVRGQLPGIHSDVRKHLAPHDPRRMRLEKVLLQSSAVDSPHRGPSLSPVKRGGRSLDPETRENIVDASAAAHLAYRREYAQLRSFRNILLVTTLLLLSIAVAVGVWGYLQPKEFSLCFNPQEAGKIVCPTAEIPFEDPTTTPTGADIDDAVMAAVRPLDVFLIQFIGLVAAAVSGATSLRRVSGTSTPYSLTVALAVIKLPAGALTAVLGLMLMRGGFIPGLTALDSSAQILAWGIVFGAAQQLFTGMVDRQAQGVLENVGGKPHDLADRPVTT